MQAFFKHPSPEFRNFPWYFPADRCFALTRDTVQHCTRVQACSCITELLVNTFTSKTPKDSQCKRLSLTDPVWKQNDRSSRGLWPLHFLDLTSCEIFGGKFKRKGPKQIYTLCKNYETTSVARFQQFQGKYSTRPITCSAGTPSAFDQEGTIFRTCCSAGDFFSDFLNIIIRENLFLAAFTDC